MTAAPNDLDMQGVADLAGVPKNTVKVWRQRHGDFPEPVRHIGASPMFSRRDVEAWLKKPRKPGRPAAVAK